jgi:uncharacterized protein with GYD domain
VTSGTERDLIAFGHYDRLAIGEFPDEEAAASAALAAAGGGSLFELLRRV